MIVNASIWGALSDAANNNVFNLVGTGAPTNGTSGTAAGLAGPGSTYTDYTNKKVYVNTNTLASPTWDLLGLTGLTGDVTVTGGGVTAIGANKVLASMLATGVLQYSSGVISSAAVIGTVAGQLGHANGVVLQAAPAANFALQLVAMGIYYTFATASYTAGGNITANYGAGGAAVSGLASAANSIGATASKALVFYPLAAAGNPVVSAAALNLVSSAAFTNPGTAAGTVAWEIWSRIMAVGF